MGLLRIVRAALTGTFSDIKQESLYTIISDDRLEDVLKNGMAPRLTDLWIMLEKPETLAAQVADLAIAETVHALKIDVSKCAPKTFVPGDLIGEKAVDGEPIHLAIKQISPKAISLFPMPELASTGPSPR